MMTRDCQQHERCIEQALERARRICHQRRARLTPLRASILELIWRSRKPLGAYALMELLSQRRAQEVGGRTATAPPTIYRGLDFLQQQGLVHRIACLNAYVGCEHPGHQRSGCFLICSECLNTEEMSGETLTSAIDALASDNGFEVHHSAVEVTGLCRTCSGQAP